MRTPELAEAGARLRSLSLEERTRRLERVLGILARGDSVIRRDLESRLPDASGFSPEIVRQGLAGAFGAWAESGLGTLVTGELGGSANRDLERAPHSTAVVAAGAIPMPTIEAVIAPLLLGSTVAVRPAQRDPITASAFRSALLDADELLGACVAVCEIARGDEGALAGFLDADAVVASGSDASVAAIRTRVRPGSRFVGYGHRLSIALVGGAPTSDAVAGLGLDVISWDQLGCLSPVAVFAFSHGNEWADALAAELESIADTPRGDVPLEAAAATRREVAEAELRSAGTDGVRVRAGRDFVVVQEADARWRPSPLHRFVRVHPVAGLAALLEALEPVREQLSSVGFGPGLAEQTAGLAPRRAPLGSMQTPPFHWNHDGIGTLRPLLGLPPLGD